MNPIALTERLVKLVGRYQAAEIVNTSNSELNGMTPLEALDKGHTRAVTRLLELAEARHAHALEAMEWRPAEDPE